MELLERVAATGLLERGRPVVVLLSGGRDSVCLLDVAVRLCGAGAVRALHVNYGLRAEADGDEAHCAGLCAALGVALEVHRAARPADAPGNLQAWARDVRYAAAARLATAAFPPEGGSPLSFKALVLEAWCRTMLGEGDEVRDRGAKADEAGVP
jgi:tRNA(Ile)-lysidine synthase